MPLQQPPELFHKAQVFECKHALISVLLIQSSNYQNTTPTLNRYCQDHFSWSKSSLYFGLVWNYGFVNSALTPIRGSLLYLLVAYHICTPLSTIYYTLCRCRVYNEAMGIGQRENTKIRKIWWIQNICRCRRKFFSVFLVHFSICQLIQVNVKRFTPHSSIQISTENTISALNMHCLHDGSSIRFFP